jgi:superoxide dismutase, Fe-Mn family
MAEQYTLPQLPYDFNELEPVISAEIMQIHYTKHHQAYVNNLNKALTDYAAAEAKHDISQMVALLSAIKFNGGGHINHSLFWTTLISSKKGGGHLEKGALHDAISQKYGSLDKFIEFFNTKTVGIQGSGWGWLGYDKARKSLCFATCENQDPLSTKGRCVGTCVLLTIQKCTRRLPQSNLERH